MRTYEKCDFDPICDFWLFHPQSIFRRGTRGLRNRFIDFESPLVVNLSVLF